MYFLRILPPPPIRQHLSYDDHCLDPRPTKAGSSH